MATIHNSLISLSYPLLSAFFIISTQLVVLSSAGGFTVDLIHRDSPKSPFYNPSATKTERFTDAVRRSFSRASRFRKQSTISPNNNIQSQIVPASGEYLMNISIGTPRFEVLAIADTGSDVAWTQCKPCVNCYKQKAPLFDPKKSSTYRALSCGTRACASVAASSCSANYTCTYTLRYGDQSFSNGDLAVETFTFGSSSGRALFAPNTVFGCGFNNDGTFNETAAGIIGLGGGALSIVTQYRDAINGKFSYCLVAKEDETSKINFGENAVVSGEGVVSTPIVKMEVDTFYYLTLESIKVGNTTVAYKKTKLPSGTESAYDGEKGNIIIDSGTTLTFLPQEMYEAVENELVKAINQKNTSDPQQFLSLCYGDLNIDIPTLTFRFAGGAELELPSSSTFVRTGENVVCFAMAGSDELAILGNLSQMNFLIGYDVVNSQISFKPTDCGKQ